jgi:hypothetical protein
MRPVVLILLPLAAGLTLAAAGLALLLIAVLVVWRGRSAMARVPVVILPVFLLVGVHGLKPLYQGGPSDAARLASLAGGIREPGDTLLVYYYSRGGLHRPVPLFYSDGPVDLVRSREDLESKVHHGDSRLLMIARREVAGLEPDFAVGILGEAGPYLLAEIRRNTAR